MFRTVLTPLDGSAFAEQALPYALGIVRRSGAILDLVHVHILYALLEPHAARYSFEPEKDEEHRREEHLYLDGTAKWLAAVSPVPMTTTVINGTDADGILQAIAASKADLIVMTTHGRGPLGRFFLGSVADEVIRRATVPVLLIRPKEPAPGVVPEPQLQNVLVPLDGSVLAERALEPAFDLVRSAEGRCTLLHVLESGPAPFSRRPGGGVSPKPEQEAAAREYLEKIARRMREEGIAVQTRIATGRHAAAVILEEAQTQRCDCIALATHGRGGVRRMLLGSVADKIVRGASTPVLVYRPPTE
jgi:nucleotide-binding universal stress UspA family protein